MIANEMAKDPVLVFRYRCARCGWITVARAQKRKCPGSLDGAPCGGDLIELPSQDATPISDLRRLCGAGGACAKAPEHPPDRCPACGSASIGRLTNGASARYLCEACDRCWQVDDGAIRRVIPYTCGSCRRRAACVARFETLAAVESRSAL